MNSQESTAQLSARLNGIIASAMDGIISVDEQQRVVLFNPAAEKMFGVRMQEALGQELNRFIPERYREAHNAHVAAFGRTGVSSRHMGALGVVSGLRANGEEFPVEASISQIRVEGEKLFTVILRDISERVRAETALRQQARLIDLAPVATMVRALDGTITFWSRGAESLYGWTRHEAIGRRSHDLLRTEFPMDLESIVAELRQHGKWSGELRHLAKGGRRVVVESHWQGQFTPGGEVVELLESNMDITERKQVEDELRRLKDELEERVKQRTAELVASNKELEAFSYSISHDLRAPIRHIGSYIKMLQHNAGSHLDEQGQRQVRVIEAAAKRMGELIDDLLVHSRLGRTTMEEREVDLSQLVKEARQELAPLMIDRAIEWHLEPLPHVRGDANLLRSVLVNLLSNAIKYTRERALARIEVGSYRKPEELVCFIRDNGAGFEMRFVHKLFGVFQRLHTVDEFEGTGIGLASVRRVIQRHGGRTWAEGAVDQGATFYFSLPLTRLLST